MKKNKKHIINFDAFLDGSRVLSRKNVEGELDLIKQIFVVMIQNAKYTSLGADVHKNKMKAIKWFMDNENTGAFTINFIVSHLFPKTNSDNITNKIKILISSDKNVIYRNDGELISLIQQLVETDEEGTKWREERKRKQREKEKIEFQEAKETIRKQVAKETIKEKVGSHKWGRRCAFQYGRKARRLDGGKNK